MENKENFNLRTAIVDDCIRIKSYLSQWGISYRMKFNIDGVETPFKEILFPLLNDKDLFEIYSKIKTIASQPMA